VTVARRRWTVGRRSAPVRCSAGCGWLDWRVTLSSGDATGGVDGAGEAPWAGVDSGRNTAAMAAPVAVRVEARRMDRNESVIVPPRDNYWG
jgi:hypothetical protein